GLNQAEGQIINDGEKLLASGVLRETDAMLGDPDFQVAMDHVVIDLGTVVVTEIGIVDEAHAPVPPAGNLLRQVPSRLSTARYRTIEMSPRQPALLVDPDRAVHARLEQAVVSVRLERAT